MPEQEYFRSFDVFLNFRGKDTRSSFTGHLYYHLRQNKFVTFIDDREIRKGRKITNELRQAIEKSRIFITVFSQNYAYSRFCLDELVKILYECRNGKGRLVLPVFYKVDPSHLKHKLGSYGEALAKHERRFKSNKKNLKNNINRLEKWKKALSAAGEFSGWHIPERDTTYEIEWILKIVKEVSRHIPPRPIGLESRMYKVNMLLNVESDNEVRMVGICGTGGIGKTTLARAVYDFYAHKFEGSCFLHNVKGNSINHGLAHLQKMLLSKIVGLKDVEIGDVGEGISMIKDMLQRKKVLLVLDDVDRLEQLQATVGQTNWLGSGSRVIITTRKLRLLRRHGVKNGKVYKVARLNDTEALDLLCSKDFKDGKLDQDYSDKFDHAVTYARPVTYARAVTYASGLPLTLEIMGSHLCGKRIDECEDAVNQYGGIPKNEIKKKILKISFDALNKDQQKILINIAHHFKEYELAEVQDKLRPIYGDHLKDDIRVLIDKSLIKINEHGQVTLHDMIYKMAIEYDLAG